MFCSVFQNETENVQIGKPTEDRDMVKSTSNCGELSQDWSAWPWIASVHYSKEKDGTQCLGDNRQTRGPNIHSRQCSGMITV